MQFLNILFHINYAISNIVPSVFVKLVYFLTHSVLKTKPKAPWTESFKTVTGGQTQVNALNVIEQFHTWINDNTDSLPQHDHAMLFTA